MRIRIQRTTFFLIGLYIFIYLIPLGARPLMIPDESRYFEVPREMIASSDWIVPRVDGIRYFEKPVLGYWLNALAMELFGQNAFAVRFPSAASVGLSAVFLFFLARKFAGGPTSGFFVVTIFLTCIQVWAIGVYSVLDSQLAMMLTGAVIAYFFAYKSDDPKRKKLFLLLSGIACGLAFLTKGFLAFVVPVVTIVPFMAWEGRLKEFFKTVWIPAVAAILIALPWSIMIYLRESDFWRYFFWVEHVERFISPNSEQHAEPFWYYVPGMIAGTLPWAVLFPAMGRGLKNVDKSNSLFRLAVCWFLFPLLFFSLSSGKILTYIQPCFPPLAILMGEGLRIYFQTNKKRAYVIGSGLLGSIILIGALVFAFNQLTGSIGKIIYSPGETWKWVTACTGLAVWSIILFAGIQRKAVHNKVIAFAMAPAFFLFSVSFVIPDSVSARKSPEQLLLNNLEHIRPDTIIVSDSGIIRAVCSYLKRTDIFLIGGPGEFEYGLAYPDTGFKRLDDQQFEQLLNKYAGKKLNGPDQPSLLLIINGRTHRKYAHLLPKIEHLDKYGKFELLCGY